MDSWLLAGEEERQTRVVGRRRVAGRDLAMGGGKRMGWNAEEEMSSEKATRTECWC